jgi:hypothetical protein
MRSCHGTSKITDGARWTLTFNRTNAGKFGKKQTGDSGGFGRHDPNKHPACSDLNRREQISTTGFVGHFGEKFHVDMRGTRARRL